MVSLKYLKNYNKEAKAAIRAKNFNLTVKQQIALIAIGDGKLQKVKKVVKTFAPVVVTEYFFDDETLDSFKRTVITSQVQSLKKTHKMLDAKNRLTVYGMKVYHQLKKSDDNFIDWLRTGKF